MQKTYLVIIDSSSTEHPYVLTIQESGNTGGQARHKNYTEDAQLTQDLKDCLNAVDDKAVATIMERIATRHTWSTEVSLTNECASRLGWIL